MKETDTIKVRDKMFRIYMKEDEIRQIVRQTAANVSNDLRDKNPLLVGTLTGAYIFMADLVRELDFDPESCFVKYTSYQGMKSTGKVQAVIPFPEKCRGRHVVIVEDIVDTGITMEAMLDELRKLEPAGIYIVSFLFKPDAFKKNFKIDYIGKSVPNDFIIGYGLDYDDFGRSFKNIYSVIEN